MAQLDQLSEDVIHEIKRRAGKDFRSDLVTRTLYSTDASIYQIEPLGVFFPENTEQLAAAVSICAEAKLPMLPRGSGSSLAGQAVGKAIIFDLSRHLRQKIDINPESQTAAVDPGVNLSRMNRAAARYGLTFGPDPASAERATIGGTIANNATGAHSILYGMSADHLVSAEVLLADGSSASLQAVSIEEARRVAQQQENGILSQIYSAALDIRDQHAQEIRTGWPKVWRRASGYAINYLLPWSPTLPPRWYLEDGNYPPIAQDQLNLAPLLAGSEGTLAIITRLTVKLVPRPKHKILGVLTYDSIEAACDAVPDLLERMPSAIELIPGSMIRLARSVPAYARQVNFVEGEPPAILVIEFSGETSAELTEAAQALGPNTLIAESPADQERVWNVRQMGLGILNARAGDEKPLAFVEDLSVPVPQLGVFVREMQHIMGSKGTYGEFYAHASAGCLHIRPVLNIKSSEGVAAMRSIAEQAVDLTLELGGAVSGEHGDGLARSMWMERAYGPKIVDLFRKLKQAADPDILLNPGKILDAPSLNENLRYASGYHTQTWKPVFDFSNQINLASAIEQCNGSGVCRKDDGLMCPSFQVTREEEHSTRGRANLLRALISRGIPDQMTAEEAVANALDLCLACKGCKAECPSAVDVARLKYEFLHHYYQTHPRRMRDFLFANIGELAGLGKPLSGLANWVFDLQPVRQVVEKTMGISANRPLPHFTNENQRNQRAQTDPRTPSDEEVLFLSDAFSRYFHPQTEGAGLIVLEQSGIKPVMLPILGAGRTFISKGYLEKARLHLERLVQAILDLDPEGRLAIVGAEPSEIYTLRDELVELVGGKEAQSISQRAWMLDEFLLRHAANGKQGERVREDSPGGGRRVLIHGHCYQKAQGPAEDGFPVGTAATIEMLERAGYQVEEIPSGCCGMAGAFGYEAEHYSISMQIGEQVLLPAVRAAEPGTIIAASGTSCRAQIADGSGVQAVHPIELLVGHTDIPQNSHSH
jgi:FAD/FMN-containing dehydrogenase/Fe-S oxidoreductase